MANPEAPQNTTLEDLNKQKQAIDAQIDALEASVLTEQEKNIQLTKLEADKQKIDEEIDKSNQGQEAGLKKDVEKSQNPNPQMLEIIKQTWLYAKLQETFKDASIYPDLNWNIEAKIDRFANQINTTVQKYLESIFLSIWEKTFPQAALKSMNTWIQFMLMDALKDSNNGAGFFSSIGSVDLSWFKSLFEWLTKTFGKWGEFLSAWKKITKTIDFLSLQPSLWDNAEKIPQLMNPSKFIQLANNQKLIWTKDISTLSLSDLWIQEWDINITQAEKDSLKQIAEKSAKKHDPKTIKAMIGALEKAEWFLAKRKDLAEWALALMDKADWMIAPFEKLLWKNMFDLLKPFKWVLNMVLSLLWFSWWLDWLQKKWLLRKIDWQLDTQGKKDFMAGAMTYFKDNISKSSVKESDSNSIVSMYSSIIGNMPTDIKAKIPLDYNVICNSIKNNLKNSEIINPLVLQELGSPWNAMILETTDANWKKTYKIDTAQFQGKEDDFIKAYTDITIQKLIKDEKFMKDIKWQEEFGLAVIGWVVVDQRYISDWIQLKAIVPSQYIVAVAAGQGPTGQNTDVPAGQWKLDVVNGKVDFSKWNFKPEQIKNINYLLDEMKTLSITDPNAQIGILSVINKESGFMPQNEISYADTPNSDIRTIFGNRVSQLSEQWLTDLKKDPMKFFDTVYGKEATAKLWWETGNTEPGDWYKYRWRGFNQLTFKNSYKKYGDLTKTDILNNPDSLNDPIIASKVVLAFFTKWKESSSIQNFTNKTDAAIYFADLNAGGNPGSHRDKAVESSLKFDVA